MQGIARCNLVTASSILPPNARPIEKEEGLKELSDLDYTAFFAIRNLAYNIKGRNLSGIINSLKGAKWQVNRIKEAQQRPDGKELFEISKIVNSHGMIKYLGFDNDSTIEMLNKKYCGKKEKGTELLIKLLKEKHERDTRGN